MVDIEQKKLAIAALFEEHNILDASIQSRNRMAFITREVQYFTDAEFEDEDVCEKGPDELKTLLCLYSSATWSHKGGFAANGWRGVRRGYTLLPQDRSENVLALFAQGNNKASIWEFFGDLNRKKKEINTKPDFKHFAMWAATNIAGESYFAGTPRKLFKRTGVGEWIDLTDETTHPNLYVDINRALQKYRKIYGKVPMGFHAVDGYSAEDIYAGGSKGDLWHFNGSRWQALDLPSNFDIESICCAPDGYVYIGGSLGSLVRGRLTGEEESWEMIPFDESPAEDVFQSMAWFQGELWLGGWRGTYHLDPKVDELMIKRYKYPDGGAKQFSFGGVCSCEDTLMAWGETQVLLYDGAQWENFIVSELSLELPNDVGDGLQKVADIQEITAKK